MQAVGRNLAELRAVRGMTLQGLADITGYTVSYLSQIERGESVPSLSGLATVAAALGVEMRELFREAAGPRLHVSRATNPLALRTGLSDSGDPAHRYTVLGAHGNEGAYTALIHQLPPSEPPLQYRHFGERFALVLAGSVRLTLGGEAHELDVGECIHYGSHEEHTFEVTSDSDATVLWIVSPAIF